MTPYFSFQFTKAQTYKDDNLELSRYHINDIYDVACYSYNYKFFAVEI